MVKTFVQYWYTLPISREEAYDKIYKWFEGQKKPTFKNSDTKKPEYMHVTQGSAMASLKKPNKRKEMIINLFDDETSLKNWNCDGNTKTVLKLQAYPPGVGSMTKGMHIGARKKWLEGYFKDLFDILGGKPMQVRFGGSAGKLKSEIMVTADGSFPEDYSWE